LRHKAAKVCTACSKFVFLKNSQKKSAKKSRPKKVGQKKSAEKSQPKKIGKKGGKNRQQERWEKRLFLNLSCCCLETGLKPVLFTQVADLISKHLKGFFGKMNIQS